ncbi:MAG: hypothetical protein ACC645_06620 [Pirellulales bacterium]
MYARHWIILMLAAVGTSFVGHVAWRESFVSRQAAHPRGPWVKQPTVRNASFVVSEGKWLTVGVPREATHLRVMSNAALVEKTSLIAPNVAGRPGWHYTIEYELVGSKGDVIDGGKYHFRTRVTQFMPFGGGTPVRDTLFADCEVVACDTRSMLYPLGQSRRDGRQLRLRLASRDGEIRDVAIRVYYRHERPRFASRFAWSRLSPERRSQLCRALAYPARLTTAYERRNLLHWQWTPAMPIGQEGSDYTRRFLYRTDDVPGVAVGGWDVIAGPVADTDRYVTFPVPVGVGDVRLAFEQVVAQERSAEPTMVELQWFGCGLQERARAWVAVTAPIGSTTIRTDGGLVQVAASHRVAVRATWRARGASEAIAEQSLVATSNLRTYHSTPEVPVEYRIAHLANQATPFRVAVRMPFEAEPTGGPSDDHSSRTCQLRWSLHTRDGRRLDAGTLSFTVVRSRYDWIDPGIGTLSVSDAATWYWSVPVEASRIRLQSDSGTLLIAGYTRPPHLSRTTRVPEEYHPFQRRQSIGRTWFLLQPEQYGARVADNQMTTVSLQERPVEDDANTLAGRYTWMRYEPRGLWKARRLLVPVTLDDTLRRKNLFQDDAGHLPWSNNGVVASERETGSKISELAYCELIANSELHVAPVGRSVGIGFRPMMIFSNPYDKPTTVRIDLDGKPYFAGRITSRRGRLTLPPWPGDVVEERVMRIVADRTMRTFVQRLRVDGAQRFLCRLAYRLDDGALRIPYDKTSADEEIVQLRAFRNASDSSRATLRATIGGIGHRAKGPMESWTVADRIYDLAHAATPSALVLDGSDDEVGPGSICFVRFGSDLPPGPYSIDLQYDGSAAYVIVSRAVAGQAPAPTVDVAYSEGRRSRVACRPPLPDTLPP